MAPRGLKALGQPPLGYRGLPGAQLRVHEIKKWEESGEPAVRSRDEAEVEPEHGGRGASDYAESLTDPLPVP